LIKHYCDHCNKEMPWEEHRCSIIRCIEGEKELCYACKEVYYKLIEEFNQKKDELYLLLQEKYFPNIKIEQL